MLILEANCRGLKCRAFARRNSRAGNSFEFRFRTFRFHAINADELAWLKELPASSARAYNYLTILSEHSLGRAMEKYLCLASIKSRTCMQ